MVHGIAELDMTKVTYQDAYCIFFLMNCFMSVKFIISFVQNYFLVHECSVASVMYDSSLFLCILVAIHLILHLF